MDLDDQAHLDDHPITYALRIPDGESRTIILLLEYSTIGNLDIAAWASQEHWIHTMRFSPEKWDWIVKVGDLSRGHWDTFIQ